MALISCPECGKEISDKAEICPNCGCPLENYEEYEEREEEKNYDEEEDDEESKEESVISICSLVLFGVAVVFTALKMVALPILFYLASFVCVIIAHFQTRKKIVCATIVFWLITVQFILAILGAIFIK